MIDRRDYGVEADDMVDALHQVQDRLRSEGLRAKCWEFKQMTEFPGYLVTVWGLTELEADGIMREGG